MTKRITVTLTQKQAIKVIQSLHLAYSEAERGVEKAFIWRLVRKFHDKLESNTLQDLVTN